ncbi:MFS transporter [Micromonospora marina]|uniref:Major Facilitator Superfamily protein n=1 Tax=Micromonospora marina TaxID=307120 RepID=A0A1C5A5T5_9ACTN|nr:MFS transporter [Micromonospora marina]SCF40441.1 Major Facilitator Superfamily protein [Micromonospora marina]
MTTMNPTPASLPAALAEPTVPVRRGWIALIFAANLGVWMAFFTPIQVLLPQQVERIAPADKEAMLAVVTGLGALAAVLANPLAGALSDRTSLRLANRHFGRRHVWTALGAVVGALALVLLARENTIAGVAVAWVAAQVCFNAMLASLTAAIPDRVPVAQRGGVSGWVGIPQALGLVLGAVLVTAVVTGNAAGYAAIALAVLLLSLPFALLTQDDHLPREHRSPLRLRSLFASMWISPRRHPDFAWAWFTRFLVQTGNALGTLYLLYTLGMVLTAVVAGRMSDRSGRRKVFVIASGLIMAVAAVLLAAAPVWPMAIVAALLLGAGYGVYLSVDAALITQVLPAATDRAKDLGVINIANSAPQVLGPALSAPIVVHLGGYPTLYAVTAAVTVLGSALVVKIRSVP